MGPKPSHDFPKALVLGFKWAKGQDMCLERAQRPQLPRRTLPAWAGRAHPAGATGRGTPQVPGWDQRWVQHPPDRTPLTESRHQGRRTVLDIIEMGERRVCLPNAAVTPWSAWQPEVWGTFWILVPADLPASGGTITSWPQALWHGSPEGGRIWAPIRRGHGDQSASCVQGCWDHGPGLWDVTQVWSLSSQGSGLGRQAASTSTGEGGTVESRKIMETVTQTELPGGSLRALHPARLPPRWVLERSGKERTCRKGQVPIQGTRPLLSGSLRTPGIIPKAGKLRPSPGFRRPSRDQTTGSHLRAEKAEVWGFWSGTHRWPCSWTVRQVSGGAWTG